MKTCTVFFFFRRVMLNLNVPLNIKESKLITYIAGRKFTLRKNAILAI